MKKYKVHFIDRKHNIGCGMKYRRTRDTTNDPMRVTCKLCRAYLNRK